MQPSRTTRTSPLPEFLYHYYESACGPFRSLSDLTPEEAAVVQEQIRLEGRRFASRRTPDYLKIRRELETHIRDFIYCQGGPSAARTAALYDTWIMRMVKIMVCGRSRGAGAVERLQSIGCQLYLWRFLSGDAVSRMAAPTAGRYIC
jgi:hypothetical protein